MTLIDLGKGRICLDDGCPRCDVDKMVIGPPNHSITAGDVNEAAARPNVLCQCGAELDIQKGRVWYRGQLSFPPERDVREVSDSLPQRVAAPIEIRVHDDETVDGSGLSTTEDEGDGGSEEDSEPPSDTTVLPEWIGENAQGEPCEICVSRYEDPEKPNEPCFHHPRE